MGERQSDDPRAGRAGRADDGTVDDDGDVGADAEPEADARADVGAEAADLDADAPSHPGSGPTDGPASTGEDDPAPGLSIVEARQTALEAAGSLLDHDVEDVIKIETTDDGWRVVVEVIERSAIPDTQDILGRYEFSITDGAVTEYALLERYHRGEMRSEL